MEDSSYWSRIATVAMSRRALMRSAIAAGAGAAGLALVGCGDGGENGGSPQQAGGALLGTEDLRALTIVEADRRIAAGELSPVALAEACLARIQETQPTVNAFITITADDALRDARAAEERARRRERRGPLDGIPLALKDLFETAGVRTTAASNILRDNVPQRDATVVARLKEAGAVLLGKLNMYEWAFGPDASAFGLVHNPWDPERITGGSSSGSAAGLAASQFLGAMGTDTGGSVRIPSSLCGTVGLKPTFGRVSMRGVLPMSRSLDHAGPMGRCVEDVAVMLQAIAGYDPEEPATLAAPLPDYREACQGRVAGMKIGILRGWLAGADEPVLHAFETALDVMRSLGAEVRDVKAPDVGGLMDPPDTGSVLGAWNGVAWRETVVYHEQWWAERPQDYQQGTQSILSLVSGVKAADYDKARQVQQALKESVAALFRDVDILAVPTTAWTATRIEDEAAGKGHILELHRLTALFNLTGMPAISIPCGFNQGLPVGLQLVGPELDEPAVLRAAYAYEQATQWHLARPQL